MMFSILTTYLLLALFIFAHNASGTYVLLDNFTGSSFLSGFNFHSGSDPTHGFVRYLTESDAQSQGLLNVSNGNVYIGVDYTNKAPNGRASIRLESKTTYQKGFFVLDLAHMPSSTCGTWPSFWTWGDAKEWPELGEIDIIEGIHTNTVNVMSLHTADGCSIDGKGSLGSPQTLNCYITAAGQTANAGCGIQSSSTSSFGTLFNAGGGGVYATEWTSKSIKIWFFPRNAIPVDLSAGGNVDPGTWGTPQASFQGACDFDRSFGNQRIVLDTTFCGDWAGAIWRRCAASTLEGDCNTYVANNPGAFTESYWRVNYFRVFKQQ